MFEGKVPLFLVSDALRGFSESFHILRLDAPLSVSLNGHDYFVLVNLTQDSGKGRNNPDECRIQLSPNQIRAYKPNYLTGKATLICGFEPQYRVFTIWETDHVLRRSPKTFSVYSRYSALGDAQQFGFSVFEFRSQILKRRSKAINFLPEYFGFVCENLSALFELDIDALYEARDFYHTTVSKTHTQVKYTKPHKKEIKGKQIQITRLAFLRDPRFRQDVMRAYNSKCCICGIQLALVEAAHIVPHSDENSDDSVGNGLALCANHHKSYDSGLLVPHEDYTLRLNKDREEFLHEFGLSDELEQLKAYHGKQIRLPDDPKDHPDPENLKVGRKMRLS